MKYRIESRIGWQELAAKLQSADATTTARCRRLVTARAAGLLVRSGGTGLPDIERSSNTFVDLQSLADAADSKYLDALEASAGLASQETLKRFAVARALAALVFVAGGDGPAELLEAAYELSVVSETEENGLHGDISAVVTT